MMSVGSAYVLPALIGYFNHQIYYEDRFGGGLIGVDADRTLGSVLASNG